MSNVKRKTSSAELSPLVLGMVNRKEVSGSFKLKHLIRILERIGIYDEIRDRRRRSVTLWQLILFAALFVSLLTLFFSVGAIPDDMGLLILIPLTALSVAIAAAVAIIVMFFKIKAWKKSDLCNDFRLCLLPFLKAMREDIDLSGKVKLRLNLSGPCQEKVTRSIDVPSPPKTTCRRTTYTDLWCFLEAPLVADGRLLLTIVNHYTHTERARPNPRGKIKRKSKWKKRVVVKAGLAHEGGSLAFSDKAIHELAGHEDFTLTKKNGGAVVKLKRKYSFASLDDAPQETVSPRDLVSIFFLLGSTLQTSQTGR